MIKAIRISLIMSLFAIFTLGLLVCPNSTFAQSEHVAPGNTPLVQPRLDAYNLQNLSEIKELNPNSLIVPYDLATGEVREKIENTLVTRNITVIALVVSMFLLAVLASWMFARKFWTAPLEKLAEQIEHAGEGQEISVPHGAEDEIAQLAASVNKVAGDLQDTITSKRYINNILHAMNDSLIVLNLDSTIRTINSATLDMLGFEEREIIDQPFATVLEDKFSMKAFLETNTITAQEKTYINKEGKKIPVSFSCSTIADENGKTLYVVCAAQDMTERKKFQEMLKLQTWELAEKNRELNHLSELKSEFISTVSHELRTPLAIIKGALDNLSEDGMDKFTEDQIDFAKMAKSNVGRLSRLIHDLLDLSRLESGKVKAQPSKVNPSSIITETVKGFQISAKESNVELKGKTHGEIPSMHIDPDMTTQILTNLMDNAIRFTNSKVTLEAVESTRGICFSISDNGKGIPAAELKRMFNKFEQVDRPKGGAGYKGTGLGLAICKELVDCQSGKIWVESEEGKGTTFYVDIPNHELPRGKGHEQIEQEEARLHAPMPS